MHPHNCRRCKDRYGFFDFCLDAFLVMITGGLWLVWILVREVRD